MCDQSNYRPYVKLWYVVGGLSYISFFFSLNPPKWNDTCQLEHHLFSGSFNIAKKNNHLWQSCPKHDRKVFQGSSPPGVPRFYANCVRHMATRHRQLGGFWMFLGCPKNLMPSNRDGKSNNLMFPFYAYVYYVYMQYI